MPSRKIQKQSSSIPLDLVKGLSEVDRKDYEIAWRNSSYVTERIKQALLDRLESLELDTEQDYANPNWPYLRADKNGRIREIKEFLRYLP